MITIEELSRAGKLPGQLLLQVHDELLFEAQEGDVVLLEQLVKSVMEGAWKLSVPLVVAVGIGNNWDEAHS
jgi:DNA polymerase-1